MLIYDNEKIRNLMTAGRLSGNQLAKKAGISGPSMHAILKGVTREAKFSTISRIANALGVPIQTISKAKVGRAGRDLNAEAALAFSQLTPTDQAAMLATMLHLAAQQKKNNR